MSKRLRGSAGGSVTLRDSLIKAGLQPALVAKLESLPTRSIDVDTRRPFREPGAEQTEAMFVTSGLLSKYKSDGSGRRQIVALRFPGEGILPRAGAASFGLQAIVPTRLLIVAAKDFDPVADKHPELARMLWKRVQRHDSISAEWLMNCGRRDSVARVAHLLCETAERCGLDPEEDRILNPFTQQQIADITGQTSVNVNRVLADLERQGLIEREGRDVIFKDKVELRRVAGFQPGYLS